MHSVSTFLVDQLPRVGILCDRGIPRMGAFFDAGKQIFRGASGILSVPFARGKLAN